MKKKIVSIFLIITLMFGMLLVLTACGDDSKSSSKDTKKVTYTKGMMSLRDFDPAILDGHSAGELLDVALKNAKWREDRNYDIDYTAVIVTGKDKKTGNDIKIVWNEDYESQESSFNFSSGFVTMTVGDDEYDYLNFINYLYDYIEELDSSN